MFSISAAWSWLILPCTQEQLVSFLGHPFLDLPSSYLDMFLPVLATQISSRNFYADFFFAKTPAPPVIIDFLYPILFLFALFFNESFPPIFIAKKLTRQIL